MTDKPVRPSATSKDGGDLKGKLVRRLIDSVLREEPGAWERFVLGVEPVLFELTGASALTKGVAKSIDARRSVVVLVLSRLREDDHRRLGLFADRARRAGADEERVFRSWLATVVARASVDYIRSLPEYARRERSWIRFEPIVHEVPRPIAAAIDVERQAAALQLLDRASSVLDESQFRALMMWLRGSTFSEIAGAMELETPRDADRLIRSSLKRLRDRFRDDVALQPGGKS